MTGDDRKYRDSLSRPLTGGIIDDLAGEFMSDDERIVICLSTPSRDVTSAYATGADGDGNFVVIRRRECAYFLHKFNRIAAFYERHRCVIH